MKRRGRLKSRTYNRVPHVSLWLLLACCSCGLDKRPITQIGLNDMQVTVIGEQATNTVWSHDWVGDNARYRYDVGGRRITIIQRRLFIDDRGYGPLDWQARIRVDGDSGTVLVKGRIATGRPLTSNEVYWLASPGVSNITYRHSDEEKDAQAPSSPSITETRCEKTCRNVRLMSLH